MILLSTIGYGLIITKIIKFENFNYNYGIVGILGLFGLSIISSYTHLFLPHGSTHNIIIIILGLVSLIIFDNNKITKIKYTISIFVLLFICLLIAKTNEDFGYYHLPNSLQFSQQKLQFGLGNLNHGFKHISTIFMLMSLNYLPGYEFYLYNLTNLLFLNYLVIFILKEIYLKHKNNSSISNVILSFILILFLAKFSRLAEYGSDMSGQIIISIYIFYMLELFFNKKITFNQKIKYTKISIVLIIFAITLKFISVIYITLISLFIILANNKKKIFFEILNPNFLIIIFLSILIFIFLNFSATGCLIYPIEKLCFAEKFKWALSRETVNYLNFHYEIWSKAGIGPNFSIENKEDYIIFLNWVPNWINLYFFGKFTDYIFVILSMIVVYSLFFYKEIFFIKCNFKKKSKVFLYYYLALIITFLLWFFNFPTLRYAGFLVVFLLIIFPYTLFLINRINFTNKNILKKISIIFVISYSIFLMKNISRINNELKLDINEHHNFKDFPFYWIKKNEFEKIELNYHELYFTENSCWATPSTCIRDKNIKVTKKNNYIFYSKK